MIETNLDSVAAYSMIREESGSAEVKNFFFWSSPDLSRKNSSSTDVTTFFWSSPD